MTKVLKTAAIVVGAVALVATGIGAAAGAGLIGATVAGTATFAGVAASTFATIGTLAGVAAGALSIGAMLTAKPPPVTGNQTSFSANPDDGLPWLIGRSGTAGKISYRVGFDTRDAGDNDRQSFVSVLSVGPIDAIEGQTVDQVPTSYTPGGAAIGAYSGWMWSLTQLGAMPEAAPLGFGAGAGTPPGWSAQHKLSGKAAASWTLRFDTKGKQFQAGVPAPLWIARGARCYDPTKDSTYPGGNGPHRIADPSDTAAYDAAMATWEWTENPFLIAMRWAHGIWQRDRSNPSSAYQRVMGIGAAWALINVAAFVEGRNIAAAHGWKAGGVVYSTDGKWDAMKRILQAGMGEPMALGARISCLVNAPKVSLATITVDDVVGSAKVATTQPQRDRLNTITPRYRLEANNWQFLPGSPISVPEHVAFDRGKRSRLIDYPYIQSTSQVATAVRYDIENAREFGPIVLPLKLVWMGYKPGDCVTATLPEVGLNAQPILLLSRQLAPAGGIVTMTARSETPGKHAFALGQTTTPPPTPGVTAQPLVPTPKDGAWTLSALAAGNQLVTPTIAIGGTCEANVDGIVFEYRVFDSGAPWTAAGSDAPTATYREITGLRAGTAYEVAVSYVRAGVSGDRRTIGPVTTAVVSVKGDKGDDGVSAYAILLTNESHILPADAAGNVTSYNGAATDVVVYAAGADVTSSFALSVTDNPQALAISIAGRRATVTGGLDASEPNAVVTLRMTGSGPYAGVVLEKVFGLTKSRAGADAKPPVLIAIDASAQTVRYDTAGAFVPGQSITFTATRQNTAQPAVFRLVAAGGGEAFAAVAAGWVSARPDLYSSSGPDSLTFNATALEANIRDNGGPVGMFSMRASVDDGGRYFVDTVSVQKVRDGARGADALTAYLTNEAHNVAANSDGYAYSYSGAFGQFKVFLGGVDVTGGCTFAKVSDSIINADINASGQYGLTAFPPAAKSGYAIFRATYPGYPPIDLTFSLTKTNEGADGSPAVDIKLTASSQQARYNAAGALVSGDITFTVKRQNLAEVPIFRFEDLSGGAHADSTAAGLVASSPNIFSSTGPDNLTITAAWVNALMAHGGQGFARVIVRPNSEVVSDRLSIVKVKDGVDGTSAYSIILSNEAQQLPADKDGNVLSYDSARTSLKVLYGATDVTAQFGYVYNDPPVQNPQGLSVAYDPAFPAFAIVGGFDATEAAASFTFRVQGSGEHAGVALEKTLSLTKSKAAADGVSPPLLTLSASSLTARYNKPSQLVSGGITFAVERKNTGSTPVFRFEALDGSPHAQGTSASLAASSPNVFSTTGADNLTITAAWVDALMAHAGQGFVRVKAFVDTGTPSDTLSIVKVKDGADGAPGQSAYVLLLSNELHTVPADAAGNVTTYAGALFSYRVLYGASDVTSDFQLTSSSNPQGLNINGTFPDYSVGGGLDAGEDVAIFTGVISGKAGTSHAGVSLTKTFTLAKSKAGANPPLITLSSDKDYARFDKADAYVGGAITFTAVRQNIPGSGTYFKVFRVSDGALLAANTSEAYASGSPGQFAGSGGDKLVMTAQGVTDYLAATGGAFRVEAYRDGYAVTDSVSIAKVKDGEDGAPGVSPVLITAQPDTVQLQGNADGVVAAGSLPQYVRLAATRAGADVAISSITVTETSGCTASPAQDGVSVQITAVSALLGHFIAQVTAGGQTTARKVTFGVQRATPSLEERVAGTMQDVTSTTYVDLLVTPVQIVVPSSGKISAAISGVYYAGGSQATGHARMTSKLQYRLTGGSWVDIPGTEGTGSEAYRFRGGPGEPGDNGPGAVYRGAGTITGLAPGAIYEVRALGFYRTDVPSPVNTISGMDARVTVRQEA